MTGCCPNKKLIRYLKKGEKKLRKEFDHVKIIKDVKKLQILFNRHYQNETVKTVKDKINVDNSTSSDENAAPMEVIKR